MGFIRANMLPILREGKRAPFHGRLLLLGQGDMYFAYYQLEQMAQIARYDLKSDVLLVDAEKPHLRDKGYVRCREVFLKLGFSDVDVLDYSEFEGANVIHDLNSPNAPSKLVGAYDVIIDHGTLEHIFHLPNALNALFSLLRVGGRLITSSPTSGFLEHGFYMLQPTLFADWYKTNEWEINSIQLALLGEDQENTPPFFADYVPGVFDSLGHGKLSPLMHSTITVATKTEISTGNRIPMQGYYARISDWQK
jgi:hypothetical protein